MRTWTTNLATIFVFSFALLPTGAMAAALEEKSCLTDAKTSFAKRFCQNALNKSNIYQSLLGYLYWQSPDEIELSDAKGFYWLRAASRNTINHGFGNASETQKQTLIQAMFDTAESYRLGKGTTKNDKNALFWYQKAANQGYLAAYKKVAEFNLKGKGTRKNTAEAAIWLEKAARQEDVDSQVKLAGLYEKGKGIKKSRYLAMKWYKDACQQNSQIACTAYQKLEKQK